MKNLSFAIFALVILSVAFLPAMSAAAQTADNDGKKSYKIGIYLLNVGKVDLQTNSYDLDFYMWVESDDEDFTKTRPNIEFINGKTTTETISIEPHYYEMRVKGTFLKNMNFQQYPFEQIHLTVEVEGIGETSNLILVADNEHGGVDNLVNIPGWNLSGFTSETKTHSYPDGKEYSRYVYTVTIERFFISSFLKTIFPIVIITTIAMLAFWMSPNSFAPRIGLGASTMLAAVAAHLSAASQLPPIGYLTLFDKIMVIAYALFLNNLLSMVIQMRYVERDMKDKAILINAKMRKLMPVICAAIFFALILI